MENNEKLVSDLQEHSIDVQAFESRAIEAHHAYQAYCYEKERMAFIQEMSRIFGIYEDFDYNLEHWVGSTKLFWKNDNSTKGGSLHAEVACPNGERESAPIKSLADLGFMLCRVSGYMSSKDIEDAENDPNCIAILSVKPLNKIMGDEFEGYVPKFKFESAPDYLARNEKEQKEKDLE
jgi:hypothetical protein